MRLHKMSPRYKFYNEGDAYKLIPIHRQMVVPGQSGNLGGTVKLQSAAFTNNLLSGGMLSIFFFYVPFRLIWDEWVNFVAQDDNAPSTVPTTATNWPFVFDRDVVPRNHSALFRRAYKLCYNEFFGDEEMDAGGTRTWYSDITADSTVTEMDLINTEQFSARLIADNALASPTYDATTVPIDLNDFYRQMISARSARKAQMSGDKYVDALRRMGVEPDWRIQNAPEFLHRADVDLKPVKTFSTFNNGTTDTTGESVARYEHTVQIDMKRKMFAEHGYIVGVAAFRPHIFNRAMDQMPDGYAQNLEDFFLGDNLKAQDDYNESLISLASTDDVYAQRFAYLRNGLHMYGAAREWVNWINPAVFQDAVFPSGPNLNVSDELNGNQVAIHSEVQFFGQTPVPPNSI